MNDLHTRLFDAPYLAGLRAHVRAASPQAPATALLLAPVPLPELRRLGVFSGSFNPLTLAHCAVVEAATATGSFDLISYTLSTLTTDKEQVTGVALDDRLAVLLAHTSDRTGEGVLLLNRGLYVEQARALRSALPSLEHLWFIVGFDKIVQIFDPRYYTERDAALDELFRMASFLVAPRAGASRAELAVLLAQPENQRFQDRVQFLLVPDGYAEFSSTQTRDQLGRGVTPTGLPDAMRAMIAATRAYHAPGESGVEAYAVRRALLDTVWNGQAPDARPAELARQWQASLTGASD